MSDLINPELANPLWSLQKLREMSRGNEAFVLKMTRIFMEQTPPRLQELEKAFEQDNLVLMGEIAHKMKPGLDSFMVDSLKETVRRLEKSGDQAPDQNQADVLTFIETVRMVLREMEQQRLG